MNYSQLQPPAWGETQAYLLELNNYWTLIDSQNVKLKKIRAKELTPPYTAIKIVILSSANYGKKFWNTQKGCVII